MAAPQVAALEREVFNLGARLQNPEKHEAKHTAMQKQMVEVRPCCFLPLPARANAASPSGQPA